MSKSKVPAKSGFDPKAYVRQGVTKQDVMEIKASFDLFDSDQGGSIDIEGTLQPTQNSRLP